MLNIHFGSCEGEIYNPPVYFKNQYEDEWITDELSKEMILDIDRSTVVGTHLIESPVFGPISPGELSGGVKTLMLLAFDTSGRIFNATACGNNCAKWILKIAENKDLTVTLHNIMDFGDGPFRIRVLNNDQIVTNALDYIRLAGRYV